MSGIVGIVNLDGAPVDRRALARMTGSLTFRGPDAQHTWIEGAAGFGHTLFKTTNESGSERQPFTLDGNVWVVADARIDARRELIAELTAQGHQVASDIPDVELIARAYCVWQEKCVDHLLGDFAFGIWDAPRNRLFCARDHMGIKQLYYACLGSSIVFSNTLDCIRQHPSVSGRLNDLAIADFLLFNMKCDQAITTFADIERVPPAHTAAWSENGLRLRRYWTLPIDEPLFYQRHDDYVDRFKDLLRTAVCDRLRTDRIGLFMSGGLDSTTLAATARDLLHKNILNPSVNAFTIGSQTDDQEFYYATLVAKSLGFSVELCPWDPDCVDPQWYQTSFHTPEPTPYPTSMPAVWSNHRRLASHARVAFYGEGPDNALRCEWRPYFSYLAGKGRFGRILYDLCFQVVLHRRIPVPVVPWIAKLRRSPDVPEPFFPDWFNPEFEKRLELRSRWDRLKVPEASPHHPIRPIGHSSFAIPIWQAIFEQFQPEYTRSLLEVRHPFLDIRLLRFLLAVPALPWCRNKYLVRKSMRGLLPEPVLRRPKTPLLHDPWTKHMLELGLPPVNLTPALEEYVDRNRLLQSPASGPARFWVDFRVRSLGYWLQNMDLFTEVPQLVDPSPTASPEAAKQNLLPRTS